MFKTGRRKHLVRFNIAAMKEVALFQSGKSLPKTPNAVRDARGTSIAVNVLARGWVDHGVVWQAEVTVLRIRVYILKEGRVTVRAVVIKKHVLNGNAL